MLPYFLRKLIIQHILWVVHLFEVFSFFLCANLHVRVAIVWPLLNLKGLSCQWANVLLLRLTLLTHTFCMCPVQTRMLHLTLACMTKPPGPNKQKSIPWVLTILSCRIYWIISYLSMFRSLLLAVFFHPRVLLLFFLPSFLLPFIFHFFPFFLPLFSFSKFLPLCAQLPIQYFNLLSFIFKEKSFFLFFSQLPPPIVSVFDHVFSPPHPLFLPQSFHVYLIYLLDLTSFFPFHLYGPHSTLFRDVCELPLKTCHITFSHFCHLIQTTIQGTHKDNLHVCPVLDLYSMHLCSKARPIKKRSRNY